MCIRDRRGVKHFDDALSACSCTSEHHKDRGDHKDAHENQHDVTDEADQLSCAQLVVSDHVTSKPDDGNGGSVEDEEHDRHDSYDKVSGPDGCIAQLVTGLFELGLLMRLTNKCFDNADADQVFLDRAVHGIDLCLHCREESFCLSHNKPDSCYKQGNSDKQNDCKLGIDGDGKDERTDQHERGTSQDAHAHEQCVLKLQHIVCESCDQGGSTECVDV